MLRLKSDIAYLGEKNMFARLLESVLTTNGYKLDLFSHPRPLVSSVTARLEDYAAVLVDADSDERLPDEIYSLLSSVPVIIVNPSTDQQLTARARQGTYTLGRPLSIPRLMSMIQRFSRPLSADRQTCTPERPETAKILVVDDEEAFRIFVEHILEKEGFSVLTATDGVQALELLDEHPEIETFVIDLEMPRMDGRMLIEELHKRLETPCVLIMTGTQNLQLRNWLNAKGSAFALIEKPFSSKTFLRYLDPSTKSPH